MPTGAQRPAIVRKITNTNTKGETMGTLFQRLEAMGYTPTERRGKIWLDGQPVADIVGGLPVSYTRRRYPGCFFCWVEAYAGGWFSLGDPWQAVTPARKSIEAQIEHLQRLQKLTEAGTANPAN